MKEVFTENEPTDVNEMVLGCSTDDDYLHHKGWTYVGSADDLYLRQPDGNNRTTTQVDLRNPETAPTGDSMISRFERGSIGSVAKLADIDNGYLDRLALDHLHRWRVCRSVATGGLAFGDAAIATARQHKTENDDQRCADNEPRRISECKLRRRFPLDTDVARPVDLRIAVMRPLGSCGSSALTQSPCCKPAISAASTGQQPMRPLLLPFSDLKQIWPADAESTNPVARVAAVVHEAIAITATRATSVAEHPRMTVVRVSLPTASSMRSSPPTRNRRVWATSAASQPHRRGVRCRRDSRYLARAEEEYEFAGEVLSRAVEAAYADGDVDRKAAVGALVDQRMDNEFAVVGQYVGVGRG